MSGLTQLDLCADDVTDDTINPSLAPASAMRLRVEVVSGRDAVLACAGLLRELAGRCGQPGTMHGLDYLLDHPYTARKKPYLLRFFSEDGERTLHGAVVLFEYQVGAWRTGLLSTGDSFGIRTVLGPEHLRSAIAAKACLAMLQRGCRMVLVSYRQQPVPQEFLIGQEAAETRYLWAKQTRQVRDRLPLAATVDATLVQLGKRTRTHLRYYRRRLEQTIPCHFLADVSRMIDPADTALLRQLNRNSLDPIAQETFNLQYRSTLESPEGFVSGLRSKQGQWLALVGGWRQDRTTWVQWQSNTRGFESFSVGTVVRAFLIEQEVARGSRWLAFHGGTSHSMAHAFPFERVVDLIVRRDGLLAELLVRTVPALHRRFPRLASRGNFLADALGTPGLRWLPNFLPRDETSS